MRTHVLSLVIAYLSKIEIFRYPAIYILLIQAYLFIFSTLLPLTKVLGILEFSEINSTHILFKCIKHYYLVWLYLFHC